MNTILKFPFYAKASILIIGLYAFVNMLYVAQDIILPVIYATIIAILVSPAVNFLTQKRVNRTISISIVLAASMLIIIGLIALLSSQVSRLSDSWPQLAVKFQELLNLIAKWAAAFFNSSPNKINAWMLNAKVELMNNSNAVLGNTLTTMSGILATSLLTPVYVFMLLSYQPHLIDFTHRIFGVSNNSQVSEILIETKSIIKSFLVGLFAEFLILSILNAVGLLLLGIDYPILLGITGAVLNVIPYLGGIIGVVLFMVVALVTKSPVYVLYVIALYSVIQLVDNNYIVPKIVGSRVKINALVSIIVVIAGSALWGIPGMFLSIPLTAILKLILDRIESLKPWGFLLGDSTPALVILKK